jgi:diadenosine tetraphosphate (Ap4A) HIT family hydrolase
MSCPFCERIALGEYSMSSELAVAFEDAFPVTPGHMLVIPRRHESDFFALSQEEQAAVLELARSVQASLRGSDGDGGLNIGLNIGAAAGQTVWHAHLHVIPRVEGDVDDPRGGVRWVIPSRAAYWSTEMAGMRGSSQLAGVGDGGSEARRVV